MSLIATFRIETSVLRDALAAAPEMTLQTEDLHAFADEPTRGIFWAWGGDFEAFEEGLASDPTVGVYRVLAETGDQRLYRVSFSEAGEGALTYPTAAKHDVALQRLIGTFEALEIQARFPTREALTAYRATCEERNVPFHLDRIYREESVVGDGDGDRYGLTDPQHEALRRALEMGYFDIPRRTTLEAVADELDVSVQAVSTRLRRGQKNLLSHTVASTSNS